MIFVYVLFRRDGAALLTGESVNRRGDGLHWQGFQGTGICTKKDLQGPSAHAKVTQKCAPEERH
jgi:hypothetical protein